MTDRPADQKSRIAVLCTKPQKQLLVDEAKARDTDLSTMLLAYGIRGVGGMDGDKAGAADAPVIIGGRAARALRERAAAQGISTERLLEMMLVGAP